MIVRGGDGDLKCTGDGLATGGQDVATVNVPCPTCGQVNQLVFEPNGTVRSPCGSRRADDPLPTFSLN